ncbi:MAG: T9SS type A sorting domain-containing protein, partial [Bacteroidales bacterium]|nr:T9SS type A sorting domain-containing protein [Bacteroidales bacterium]
TAQDLSVKTSTDGAILELTAPVSQGDTLVVVSADGNNITKYVLDVTPLDNNVNLALSDGATLTIEATAVSGFEQGTTLEDVLGGVKTESDLSIINIIDGTGALIPLKVMDVDGAYHPVLATSDMYFEVVALSGARKQYQLTPNTNVGDAFVLSSVYAVDNEYHIITGIPGGTAVSSFMNNIIPAEGAVVTIIDKADYDRTLGNLVFDDLLKVVSSDGSITVTYMLNFVDELIVNSAPTATLASDNIEFKVGVASSVSVTAEDDGLPAPPSELSYTWSVISGEAANVTIANPNQATTDVTFSAIGSYELQVLVSDGELETTATVSASVIVGIENHLSEFNMYPNPASESFTLEMTNRGNEIPMVSIYTVTGETVYKETCLTNTKVIDVSSLDAGLYFVKIDMGDESFTKKLSILK